MSAEPSTDARFRDVFFAHRDDVWSYCARRLPAEEAHDAVADVFTVVWRRFEELPPESEARLWLFGIARNVVRNRQRAARRRLRLVARMGSLHAPEAPSADLGAQDRADRRAVRRAVDELDEADREMLRLRIWEELSLSEIAALTGRSTRSVESRLARLRAHLAEILGSPSAESDADPVRSRRPSRVPLTRQEPGEMWLSPTRDEGGER